jgi:hypothetical protein
MFHYLCLRPRTLHVPPPLPSPGITHNERDVMSRYLTEIAKVDIYWTGSRLTRLPPIIPPVGKNISRQAIVPWRYHFNTGTTPYYHLCFFRMKINWSHVLVYNSMVDLGRMGEYVGLDGPSRNKPPSVMVRPPSFPQSTPPLPSFRLRPRQLLCGLF